MGTDVRQTARSPRVLAIARTLGSSLVYGVSDFLGGLKSRSLPLLWVLLISQGSALPFSR
jgi:hypothetical protein